MGLSDIPADAPAVPGILDWVRNAKAQSGMRSMPPQVKPASLISPLPLNQPNVEDRGTSNLGQPGTLKSLQEQMQEIETVNR